MFDPDHRGIPPGVDLQDTDPQEADSSNPLGDAAIGSHPRLVQDCAQRGHFGCYVNPPHPPLPSRSASSTTRALGGGRTVGSLIIPKRHDPRSIPALFGRGFP